MCGRIPQCAEEFQGLGSQGDGVGERGSLPDIPGINRPGPLGRLRGRAGRAEDARVVTRGALPGGVPQGVLPGGCHSCQPSEPLGLIPRQCLAAREEPQGAGVRERSSPPSVPGAGCTRAARTSPRRGRVSGGGLARLPEGLCPEGLPEGHRLEGAMRVCHRGRSDVFRGRARRREMISPVGRDRYPFRTGRPERRTPLVEHLGEGRTRYAGCRGV